MAAVAPGVVSVEEYLRTVYRPDCDYVDGEVQERNFGEREHAAVQAALGRWFHLHRNEWNIYVYPELRVQVAPTRFRVPDICVLARDLPREQIITIPPLVCIEVLSPEDRVSRMLDKIADYRNFGVPSIWLIDPEKRDGFDCRSDGPRRTTHFQAEDSPIRLDLDSLFADVD